MNKKQMQESIDLLNFEEKKEFGFFCFDRIIDLYKDVDLNVNINIADKNIEKGTAFLTLKSIYKFLKETNKPSLFEIESRVKLSYSLILDIEELFDNNIPNILASLVAQGLNYLLIFEIEKNDELIYNCSENNLEILNQLKSEYFFKIMDGNDEDLDDFLDQIFENEYKIQLQAIELIKQNKKEELDILCRNTIIN
ncbi:hypothetical protein C3B47_13920 [Flavobacterium columnare]|uniref:Uncharacterized protein n=2 Tax=Flavobacterium columnare TaxID=996 RepID=G8XAJ6_FLACA|nr:MULTISPECIES: hypothetical protein [Flavobacterium]OXA74171.1 hypothetical protein B0A56_12875 [Flavobacterium columnare NBRC 100251 = ATCC 23463]AEW86667.1 hypothetical protein FCOL_09290 [Flavobacterium columnare ATCC 49512]MBF6653952.1 hypothetical protein [Flavobacterium columnare]MBF6657716.1 hypothetical protein [Flavobacterium columnare]MCH4829565.1 hypothetical protein [Flavobacterium columnare]